jgi:serine/threonine-protein kinase
VHIEAKPGSILARRYEILRTMARGGMGIVYEAFDDRAGQRVALKLIRPDRGASAEIRDRFVRERNVLRLLRHPAIVRLHDAGHLEDGTMYIAMEMLRGESLAERLQRWGAVHPAEVARIVTAIAGALDAAHAQGVTHRDVKPGNVFLLEPEARVAAKLLDFGVARTAMVSGPALTRTGSTIGTVRYMAPEQVMGRKDVGAPADVYALGAVAHAALAGQPPFRGPSDADLALQVLAGKRAPLHELCPRMPRALEGVIARAMAREPEQRFGSAGELAAALLNAAASAGPPPPPPPLPAEITARHVALSAHAAIWLVGSHGTSTTDPA